MQRRLIKLWSFGLLLVAAGFGLLWAQTEVNLPVVDRLPSWYFEQGANQAVGISFGSPSEATDGIVHTDIEYEQALWFAFLHAALQQSGTNVVKGDVEVSTRGHRQGIHIEMLLVANIQIPTNYVVLEQCRLKDGPVLVLIQYQYRNSSENGKMQYEFTSSMDNGFVTKDFFQIVGVNQDENFSFSGVSEYRGNDSISIYTEEYYRGENSYFGEGISTLDTKLYNSATRNRYCLTHSYRSYIGPIYFDDLREALYLKLMCREMKQ